MILFSKRKDGGPESTVTGYFLIEWKFLFSIVLLRFDPGTRDAYHTHAFNAYSWVLRGLLRELFLKPTMVGKLETVRYHWPSLRPVFTGRSHFHQVESIGTTWVLSFRGPWVGTWEEFLPPTGKFRRLTHGRREVGQRRCAAPRCQNMCAPGKKWCWQRGEHETQDDLARRLNAVR